MPTYKGIKLNIISQWELQIHPEFAHPDSSQFTFRSPNANESREKSPDSYVSDSKADRILGRTSTVAVYIPSVSGARFWLRYSITEAAAASSPWYYFKLSMNGRLIASWGTNSATNPNGQVMRGLFDPSERWNYKDNGTIFKNNGTEVRPFFFIKEDSERSAAEEGGLIEVLVYRARGRNRRMPNPEEFRSQNQWGIVMPSGGLLEKPQDAKFYDWHLRDPKDRPFASFQFHYRSWDSLVSLQLIPSEHDRSLLLASPSLLSINGHSRELQEPPPKEDEHSSTNICVDEVEQESEPKDSESSDSISSITSNTPWLTNVFDDSPDAKHSDKPSSMSNLPRTVSSYTLNLATNIPRSKFYEAPLEEDNENTDADADDDDDADDDEPIRLPSSPPRRWGDILDRPLPEIPTRTSSKKFGQHSRSSSATSNAVSITPSLRSYFEREASPEPHFLGVATVMPVIASTFGLNDNLKEKTYDSVSGEELCDNALSENSSVPTANPSGRPLGGVFDIPTITHRKHRRSSPTKHLSPNKQSPFLQSENSKLVDENEYIDAETNDMEVEPSALDNNMTTLSLSESEWMCRTPSPVRGDNRDTVENLWSQGVEKPSIRDSLEGSALRKKTMNMGSRASEEIEDGTLLGKTLGADTKVEMRSGNWI